MMHAILLQLALLPLTMCRSLLALSSTSRLLRGTLPFEHLTQLHIFIGYLFCTIMILSVLLFFAFFGKTCADFLRGLDPMDGCEKMRTEIMITGCCIFGVTLLVLLSSLFRNRLRFIHFISLHHLVFVMFVLAILHTLDQEFRSATAVGQARSQTVLWFGATLALYLCDRGWSYIAMHVRATPRHSAIRCLVCACLESSFVSRLIPPAHILLTSLWFAPRSCLPRDHARVCSGSYAYSKWRSLRIDRRSFSTCRSRTASLSRQASMRACRCQPSIYPGIRFPLVPRPQRCSLFSSSRCRAQAAGLES